MNHTDADQVDQAERAQAQGELEADAAHIEQLQEAIAAELAEQQATVRSEIRAAMGWLGNILDSRGEAWAQELTLQEALNQAGDWAHDTWTEYQDEAPIRLTTKAVK